MRTRWRVAVSSSNDQHRLAEGHRRRSDRNGNSLYGADVTDDGTALWFAGASGAIGESSGVGRASQPTAVRGRSTTSTTSRTGGAGDGRLRRRRVRRVYAVRERRGETWDYTTPGSGSAINAVDFHGVRSGHIVDGNKSVFVTDDGSTWDKIGLADANVDFDGVDSDGPDDVWVSGGGGMVSTGTARMDADRHRRCRPARHRGHRRRQHRLTSVAVARCTPSAVATGPRMRRPPART
ncbi:hypothetical protein C9J85_17530 [Haloferax sp. wsp5]|nr:hypothetical protein C9J85_17530 [Haloferax sp. wsp5]